MELKVKGVIKVEKDKVSIQLPLDLARYYLWHINKAYYNTLKLFLPRYGAHVSVILPGIHKLGEGRDLRKELSEFHNKTVEVEYSIDMQIGGKSKGFTNFWVRARCSEIRFIKLKAGVKENEHYRGEHITFCSDKHSKNP